MIPLTNPHDESIWLITFVVKIRHGDSSNGFVIMIRHRDCICQRNFSGELSGGFPYMNPCQVSKWYKYHPFAAMTSLANFPTFPVPCHFVERRVNKRKRKKHLITELKKQVSFYFSDSNLSKDKYLRDMIQQDVNGYVSVNQISSFNKVNKQNIVHGC